MKPRVTKSGFSVISDANYYEVPEQFDVGSWCPTADGTGPATQVHLRFGSPPGNVMLIRFKGPGSLDALINALIEHREDVFGPMNAKARGNE